ncbi:MAG TPA: acyltransferase family protein, partial [Polyangium sp.]|nr:acyltransferase family protein [Polyangium sp.]
MKFTLVDWFVHALGYLRSRSRGNAVTSNSTGTPSNLASSGYRPDIDGLRALAVLAVWAFHLDPHWLGGGFVGVDVFFVVSGYVVTSSLSNFETQSIGSALTAFYSRRMKRLIPALLVCAVGVSLVWSFFTAPFPDEISNAAYRTGITSLVGLGNMYLAKSSHDYFDGDEIPNPFTHTWSLGVEEQFYFVFPLIVFACGAIVRRERANHVRLAFVLALSAGSLVLCAHWSHQNTAFAYYLMPSRFWELGVGCALAFADKLGYLARFSAHRQVQSHLPIASMVVLAFSAKYTSASHFPFPGAIVPVLATALLITSSRASNSLTVRGLRLPSVVYIGKLSYSLYLWHWPIICLVNRTHRLESPWVLGATIVVTSSLCVLTHHFIEEPLRHFKISQPRLVFAVAFGAMLVTGAGLETVRRARYSLFAGVPQNWAVDWNPHQDLLFVGDTLKPHDCHLTSGTNAPTGLADACFVSSQSTTRRRLFLVGDSHAFADGPMVQAGVKADSYDLYTLSHDECGVFNDKPEVEASCARYWRHVHELLTNEVHAGDIVFLATYIR